MTGKQIRQQFLDFFASKQHEIVASSPVVPHDDPTLMFTNAGMNQFKDVFLGTGTRPYKRAANTQKCIRAGGKHNDLDDVGQDTYHHTYFEMLGNWSFGDYFKKEAIRWAWELLTEVWGFEKDRLHATYFEGNEADGMEPDSETAELWRTVTDIDPAHIHRGNKKDNFWEMGDTGPCGPCSEIHVDLTSDKSGASLVNAGDPRVIELWNLVFIQFNRDAAGKLTPLPAKHVDTGMGLERLVAMLKGMADGRIGEVSNYDTDVFTPIFDAIQKRTGSPAYCATLPAENVTSRPILPSRDREGADSDSPPPLAKGGTRGGVGSERPTQQQVMIDVSYRVIADHLRCLTFALTDGAIPTNEGRGYVLRRILRRAVRYGRQYMNMHEPFLCDLVAPLANHMAGAFPELRTAHGGRNVEHVTEIIRDEEASFGKTLDRGIELFEKWAELTRRIAAGNYVTEKHLTDSPTDELLETGRWIHPKEVQLYKEAGRNVIPGGAAFKLHDTFGFPIDLTVLMAEEAGLTVDIEEYERLMEEARQQARSANEIRKTPIEENIAKFGITEFVGYDATTAESTYVLAVLRKEDDRFTRTLELKTNEEGAIILYDTPFYAEQGGQVGDSGLIEGLDRPWSFLVSDTQKIGDAYLHFGACSGGCIRSRTQPTVGSAYPHSNNRPGVSGLARAVVDRIRRQPTTQNHTSTHLLNWALREVLGDHVQQKGSLVDPEKTRFDFSHNKPVSAEELARIESLVNEKIEANLPVYAASREEDFVNEKEARKINTLRAVFGEKYPDRVRVVSIGAPITEKDAKQAGETDWLLKTPDNPKWMQYSVEFCGGTHLKTSAEAGRFVLTTEEGVAKGVRRVVGVTGETAKKAIDLAAKLLAEAGTLLVVGGAHPTTKTLAGKPPVAPRMARDAGSAVRTGEDLGAALSTFQQRVNEAVIPLSARHQLRERIAALQETLKKQQKQAASASGEAVMGAVAKLFESAQSVNGVTIVVGEVPPAGADALRGAIDWVRNKTEASAVLLVTASDDKVTLIAGMSKTVVKQGVKAGDLIKEIAPIVGGRGGGRPDMAQGGGNDPSGIPQAIKRAEEWLSDKL